LAGRRGRRKAAAERERRLSVMKAKELR